MRGPLRLAVALALGRDGEALLGGNVQAEVWVVQGPSILWGPSSKVSRVGSPGSPGGGEET